MGPCGLKKTLLKLITKLTKIPYSFFCLQNMSNLLDQKYNGIVLIKVIKDSKRKNQKKITFLS